MNKWNYTKFILILLFPSVLIAGMVVFFDPFFHYHRPIEGIPYILSNERYQNDGIARQFRYEALITGTSTSECFKTSQVERLWGMSAVKVAFAGSMLKEQAQIIDTAIKNNRDLKMVIRGLDIGRINSDKDERAYDEYPDYLYDNNPFNDFDYLFNKEVMIMIGREVLSMIRRESPTSFDDYGNWMEGKIFGKEAVLRTFERIQEGQFEAVPFTDEDLIRIKENLYQNVIRQAHDNPKISFVVIIQPLSVCVWDAAIRSGDFDNSIKTIEVALGELLSKSNIKVYGFDDDIAITGNLDNYMDTLHFSQSISDEILEAVSKEEHRITLENYSEYIDRIRDIYQNYDYDSIFE